MVLKQQKADEKLAKQEERRLKAAQKIADLEEKLLKEAQFIERSHTKPVEVAAYAQTSFSKRKKAKAKNKARGVALSKAAKDARTAARKLSYVSPPRAVDDTKVE